MKNPITVSVAAALLLIVSCVLVSCATKPKETAWVASPEDQVYWTETKETIHAAYYTLSDQSQSFVRLLLPDGTLVTLPQVVAASGTEYTDNFSYTWSVQGEHAVLQKRNDESQWETKYSNCVHIKPSSP